MSRLNPHFVILELGINDINSETNPERVANNIYRIALELQRERATVVCINGLLVTSPELNISKERISLITDVNKALKKICKNEDLIMFHKHQGLRFDNIREWSRDGYHPNTVLGRLSYYKSFRRAIFRAITKVYTQVSLFINLLKTQ